MSTLPTADQVRAARELLRTHFPPTRLVAAPSLTALLGAPVYLKLESELPTGSFKPRGALYALAMRPRDENVWEVVASSTGNHGAAVAFAARTVGIAATIFLPERANAIKRQRIADLGADVVETGRDISDAFQAAAAYAAERSAYFLNDATDPRLPAGPATIAAEIVEQATDVRTLVVPMGDTALIRGVGAVAKMQPRPLRVVGVQAERAPAYYQSWKAGRAIGTDTCDTIADGLATRTPVRANVDAIRQVVDEVLLVSETQLIAAVRHLLLEEHVVAEPAGAAATAAALAGGSLASPTALLVTGANLSPEVLARVAEPR